MQDHATEQLTKNTTEPALLVCENLSCTFNGLKAVESLNLRINRGEIVGLVGLNGAGKSTALRMFCGLQAPTEGHVKICGHSLSDQPADARKLLGYLPDPPALHNCLSVIESIEHIARLHRLDNKARRNAVDRELTRCHLKPVAYKRINVLSKGYRQRVGLALALVHQPKVLILDEPSSGLDPMQNEHLNQLIRELAHDCAVVFSTHSLADVQSCCTRIAHLKSGRMIQDNRLTSKISGTRFQLEIREAIDAKQLLSLTSVRNVAAVNATTWSVEIHGEDPSELVTEILSNSWGLRALSPDRDELHDVFSKLRLTQPIETAA